MSRLVVFFCALSAALAVGAASRADDAKPGADDSAFKDKVEICSGCHGPGGVSQTDGVPNLAGEPDLFFEWQLVYFRGETRMNELMTPAAKDLTDAKVQAAFTDAKATQSITEGVKENGKTTMKAFGGKLTPDEIKALVAYVRTLKK